MGLVIVLWFPPFSQLWLNINIFTGIKYICASLFNKYNSFPKDLQSRDHIDDKMFNSWDFLNGILFDGQMNQVWDTENTFKTLYMLNAIIMHSQYF